MPRWLVLLVLLVGCQAAPTPPTPAPAPTLPPRPTATAAAPSAPAASPAVSSGPSPSPSPKPTNPPSPVAGTPLPVTANRLELLSEADRRSVGGDATGAAQLYERVVNTPPAASESAATTVAINDYAHFRAIVAWLAAGQDDDAMEHLDALLSRDANAPLTRLAQQLWDQYSMTANVRAACAQIQPEVVTQAGPIVQALQSQGVTVDVANFCGVR